MTHLSGTVGPGGPILDVAIGISPLRAEALRKASQAVPLPQMARLLVDTGASHTCIDKSILSKLSIQPTGQIGMHTPSTGTAVHYASTYDVLLLFIPPNQQPGVPDFKAFPAHTVTECDLSAQGIHGLIGRDVLDQSRLIYSGIDKQFFLSF